MDRTKHDVMYEYFKVMMEDLDANIPGFNFAHDSENSVGFVTEFSDKVRKKYVRGAEKEYVFSVILTQYYSDSTDSINLESMNFAQHILDYIEEQDQKRNYPDFGFNCQVKKIESTQNTPGLLSVDWENKMAQYSVPCRVIYFEN